MDSRRNHDGRMDPTGSGQRQQGQGRDKLTLPLIKKRSKFRRSAPKRFVDTEREIESNRPSTQQDERPQGQGGNPSASQSVHLPTLVGTAMRTRENPSPVRGSASSPNRLILPPIENRDRVPTPHPPQQTPTSSSRQGHLRARYNRIDREGSRGGASRGGVSQGGGSQSGGSRPDSGPLHQPNILKIEFPDPPAGYEGQSSNRPSRASTVASRNANSANRSRNTSRLDNISRLSGIQGSASARSRDNIPIPSSTSVRTATGQPVQPTSTYQHQGSNSDGALIIKGIRKPSPPSGRVCNSNNLRRHSTGGRIVPPQEKDNKGLFVIENGFVKPTPPDKPKSKSKASQKRPSKPSLTSKRSSNHQSNTSLKSKRSSNHQINTSEVEVEYEADFEPLSEEDIAAANSRPASSRTGSRPPSSIPEEIEGQGGRYDYTDETFEVDEDDERPLSVIPETGGRPDSGASIPEELPGQSRPYNYQDDDMRPESNIPEDIVTSDDHDDDEDDDASPTSRC